MADVDWLLPVGHKSTSNHNRIIDHEDIIFPHGSSYHFRVANRRIASRKWHVTRERFTLSAEVLGKLRDKDAA
jgi:hypothetical protein